MLLRDSFLSLRFVESIAVIVGTRSGIPVVLNYSQGAWRSWLATGLLLLISNDLGLLYEPN